MACTLIKEKKKKKMIDTAQGSGKRLDKHISILWSLSAKLQNIRIGDRAKNIAPQTGRKYPFQVNRIPILAVI